MDGIKIEDVGIEVTWETDGIIPSTNRFCRVEDRAEVDGVMWYTVLVSKDVTEWLQNQDKRQWYIHQLRKMGYGFYITNMFDVHEELYLIIKLKFNG